MRRSWLLLFAVASGVLALDLWTKHWAVQTLQYSAPIQVIGEYVRFTYTRNSGVAFGIGAGMRFPYYVFSIVAAAAILYLFSRARAQSLTRQISLALILGGAIGNLIDRVTSGEVVDFIEVGVRQWHWPVFNVADSVVTIGVLLFVLPWSRAAGSEAEAPHASAAGDAAPAPRNAMETDDPHAEPLGSGPARGGAAGSLPGGGASGPLA